MDISKGAYADVDHGDPSFQLAMARPMQPVGDADGERGSSNFNAGEQRFVIHNAVCQHHLIVAETAKMLR